MGTVRAHRILAVAWVVAIACQPIWGAFRLYEQSGWALALHQIFAYVIVFGLGLATVATAEMSARLDDTQRWLARITFVVLIAQIGSGYSVVVGKSGTLAVHLTLAMILIALAAATAGRAVWGRRDAGRAAAAA